VLLATFNGARYLDEQLESIEAQSLPGVDVMVSDDGSSDSTLAKLETWQRRWRKGDFTIVNGPRSGFSENFRSLIVGARPEDHTYVAFSDQDDVWAVDKLEAGVAVLEHRSSDEPALYCSRSTLIDQDGIPFGRSPLFGKRPSFRNALVQSLAGGNTMVLNRAAFALLQESGQRTPFLMHDWWTYLIVSGAGGSVYYDPSPHIGYRQHRGNAIGGGIGMFDRPKRMIELLRGKFSRWSDENIHSLQRCLDLLNEDSRQALGQFERLRRARMPGVLPALLQSGIYRQTLKGNLALGVAAFLHRL